MKVHLFLVVSLLIILPFANAENASMLEWGLSEDSEINYEVKIQDIWTNETGFFVEEMDETTIIEIYHLPDIPQEVDYFIHLPAYSGGEVIPYPWVSGFWLNGTSIPSETENKSSPFWIAIMNTVFAVPIGNWSLLTIILEASYEGTDDAYNYALLENESIWGFQQSYISGNYVGYGESIYYKIDGTLASEFVNMSYILDDHMTSDLRFIKRVSRPTDTPPTSNIVPEIGIEEYLIISGVIVSLIVIVAILMKLRK